MHELLQRLGRGDARVLDMCSRAHQAWTDFFTELHTADVGTLSARLGLFQPTIVKLFDSPTLGESMMAWTAFTALLDSAGAWETNEARARELVVAFASSNCSAEVKSEARSAAISYELDKAPARPANDGREQSSWRSRF